MWANRSICSYSDFMWQNFNTKQGTQKKFKTVGMETLNTFFTNGIYFVQKN